MKRIVTITIIAALAGVCFDHAQAQVSSPLDIQFRRQAVRRLVFDHDSAIPLFMLQPSRIIKLEVEHPTIEISAAATSYRAANGLLTVSAGERSESALWIGGFNPYISLTMDRVQYPGIGGWTYGALYLYHGYPKNAERGSYEYSTEVENE